MPKNDPTTQEKLEIAKEIVTLLEEKLGSGLSYHGPEIAIIAYRAMTPEDHRRDLICGKS